jgi:hypothetical protein
MLNTAMTWVSAGLLMFAIGAGGLAAVARSQRDAARAEARAAEVARDAAQGEAKVSASAARQCVGQLDDGRARCDAALAAAADSANRARRALKRCQSDEAVAERLGAVLQ